MSRLFVAAWPPDDVLDAVEALCRPVDAGGRWTRRDQWHVTLRFLGPVDGDEVMAVLGGLRHPPASAVVGPEVQMLGEGVVHLPVDGLDPLAAAVASLTAGLGRPPEGRPFVGHLTLARIEGEPPAGVLGQGLSATFPVDSVSLVTSESGGNAARYTTVATFPLSG